MSEATTWVFPTSLPVAVMKMAVTVLKPCRYESAERQAIPAKIKKRGVSATGYAAGYSIPHGAAVKIVIVGALDLYGGNFANAQRPPGFDVDDTVDLRSVTLAAALGHALLPLRR